MTDRRIRQEDHTRRRAAAMTSPSDDVIMDYDYAGVMVGGLADKTPSVARYPPAPPLAPAASSAAAAADTRPTAVRPAGQYALFVAFETALHSRQSTRTK